MDRGDQWQLDGSAPELYQRYLVPAVTALWAADLLGRIGLRPGERVLDVACGTGVVAPGAAERVGASGQVAAIDVNAGMLEVARRLDPPVGAPIAWHEGSALDLPTTKAASTSSSASSGCSSSPIRAQRFARCDVCSLPAAAWA